MKARGWLGFGLMAVFMVALEGCDGGPDHRPATTAKVAKKQIADRFKDPDSVLFRKMSMDAEGKHLCGELNAKNGFGAYTGYEPFRADIEGVGAQVKVGTILTNTQELERISAAISAGQLTGEAIMQNVWDMLCSPDLLKESSKPGSIAIPD